MDNKLKTIINQNSLKMKKIHKRFSYSLTLFAFMLLSVNLFAQVYDATYYVSASGNDVTGDGSEQNPWATLSKTADEINGAVNTGNYLVIAMTDLTSTACARYYNNNITITSLNSNAPVIVTRGTGFGTLSDPQRSWYNPAMVELQGTDVMTGPDLSLTLSNIIFDDNYLAVATDFRYAPIGGVSSLTLVHDAIVASNYPFGTVTLDEGAELRNFGGMSAARVTNGATFIMNSGSLITDIGATTATRAMSTTATDYRAKGETAVSIAGGHFYMYNGARIIGIANAHSVKIDGTYKCFIDGEIAYMTGNKGWDATDRNTTNPKHEGRGPKNAVLFSGTTLDPWTGINGSAIIGQNANIHDNATKCGTVCVNRAGGVSVKIYGKINDNMGQAGSTWISIFSVPAGTHGGGLYIVGGGTIYLEDGSEVCRNSVMSSAYGGAASVQQGSAMLVMNGGLVKDNTASGKGPGITVSKDVTAGYDVRFEMNGGVIDNGDNGVMLFANEAPGDWTNGRLILNEGTISGVTLSNYVTFGTNETRRYRNIYITDKVTIGTGYVAAGAYMVSSTATRPVSLLPANAFGTMNIGNPNYDNAYPIIRAALPAGWGMPTTATNVIGFWMMKEEGGTAQFSVPALTTGNAPTSYNRTLNKYFAAVMKTTFKGDPDPAATLKLYPTKVVGGQIFVSIPMTDYMGTGATVALVQPTEQYGVIEITAPAELLCNPNASAYTIADTALYEMPEGFYDLLITDGHDNINTDITLYIHPDINSVPNLSSFTLTSDIFETNGAPVWNAAGGELVVPLQFKSGWDATSDLETSFSLSCELDAADFATGNVLTFDAQIVMAGDGLNTYLIPGNLAETVSVCNCAVASDITISDTATCTGNNIELTAETDIDNPTFYWYDDLSATANLIHTGNSYEFLNLTADTTCYIAVTGDGYCENEPANRKAVTVTMKAATAISAHPETALLTPKCFNTEDFPQLSVIATGANPTYQWYRNTSATTVGAVTLTDSTASTLTPTSNLTAGNYYYYCVVTGDCGKDTSDFSGVHTIHAAVTPTIAISGTLSVCEGERVTFNSAITNGGNNPTRQWIVNDEPVTGATGITFTYTPAHGDVITCELTASVTCADPAVVTASEITMTVIEIPAAPILLTDTLPAFKGMPIDLSTAVDMVPGLTYTFYANADLTGRINGSTVTFNPPKDDYYVTASFEGCEGVATQIMLKDPCPETVTDEETNEYKVTSLAGYCWTENLRTTLIPHTTDPIPFANAYTCTGCPEQLDTIFGLLYTWYSAVGEPERAAFVQGICPDGWHIPSQAEWSVLAQYPASQLKSTQYWLVSQGTDDYGFNALPAGWYNSAASRYQDLYGFAGWWAADAPANGTTTATFSFSYYCDRIEGVTKNKSDGMSVRCILDY
jgi:uncharacterized protein (TIGR02145 family)